MTHRPTYLDRLGARTVAVGSCLCLGLDPDPDALPAGFGRDALGIERFARLVLDSALPFAAAVKANVAFYEAFGSAGIAALERIRAAVPADVPFVADAKRADIASTAARQAVALFDALGADAVTANPYLGLDALEPFISRQDRFVYVLCRTSNPGATELQDRLVASGGTDATQPMPLYLGVAGLVAGWASTTEPARLGLVVGATAPAEMMLVRAAAPELPFVVPGLGAQGGDVAPVMEHGPARRGTAGRLAGGALLVNVSRGIAGAATDGAAGDPGERIAAAARHWSEVLRC